MTLGSSENTKIAFEQRSQDSGDLLPSATPLYASLNSKAVSDEARALIGVLREAVEAHEEGTSSRIYKRRGEKLEQFEFAIGAFLADLLRAANHREANGWVFRSLKAETFTGEAASHRTFKQLQEVMIGLELLTKLPGYQVWKSAGFAQADNSHLVTEAMAARFKATRTLLDLARNKGITPDSAHKHFIQALPRRPLVLKAASKQERGNKVSGKRLGIEKTPQTEQLEADVKRLNEFLDGFTLTGGIHRGYFRVFNLGDQEGFAWNKGGRLYSQGEDSYQRLKEAQRVQMTIDGDLVIEIDIKASYLTVLHGLLKLPFDPSDDPYAVEGLKPLEVNDKDMRRWVVKAWTVATLGHHQHHVRWPDRIIEEFKEATGKVLRKVYPIKAVREAMEAKHPVLKDWGSLGLSWGDLMYIESVAVMNTMLELMDEHQAPSFSVHDSLIVREKDLDGAGECLKRSYKAVAGLEPTLEITFSDGTSG